MKMSNVRDDYILTNTKRGDIGHELWINYGILPTDAEYSSQ